jgi:hypothetical protein
MMATIKTYRFDKPTGDGLQIPIGFAKKDANGGISPLGISGFEITIPGQSDGYLKAVAGASVASTSQAIYNSLTVADKANRTWLTVSLAASNDPKFPAPIARKIYRVRVRDASGTYTLVQLSIGEI